MSHHWNIFPLKFLSFQKVNLLYLRTHEKYEILLSDSILLQFHIYILLA